MPATWAAAASDGHGGWDVLGDRYATREAAIDGAKSLADILYRDESGCIRLAIGNGLEPGEYADRVVLMIGNDGSIRVDDPPG